MQIVLTFNGIEELNKYLDAHVQKALKALGIEPKKKDRELVPIEDIQAVLKQEELNKSTKKTADIINEAEKKIEAEEKKIEAEEKKEEPKVDESFRVEVRKVLSKLNKKTGQNTAHDLIQTFGVAKLTDMALSDLPALMKKAEEALNA